ncbi:phosphoribosylglycinamide formyltransferase [Candidatus Marinimicrobia bacterium]|jgi:phosphoribosylglycinamide formyltransferase-1|nr:phosphoribosylglycinamide formyltransferase [Candidatus Neomarinimicrobiota bacterium]MDC0630641.1 phosphoribosylglycinamide formyltransferase [Candidatus Neomarinimicrobiota bacterium]
MIRLGVLGSTKGTDLQAILDAISKKILKAKVSLVVSNNKNAYILKRAKNNNIPNYYISHESLSRKNFDSLVARELKKYKVDLILLIGFMRILSKEFCLEWKDKILNVHPSLLPKYAGGMDNNVHEEVLKNKDLETGCTIHFVTEKLDAGPILVQKRCAVEKNDTPLTLKEKVQVLEGEAFLEAIKLIQQKS